ncbi:MAG: CAP domain-containing protein [Deltaproteobacteria bacterium]|nr:CAP domain-containing protein [Deltaproteobacteria bacterium]
MAAIMLLAALFSWTPAAAQWSGHTSDQRYPAPRSIVVNFFAVEEAVFAMTNDIRRQNGLAVFLKDEICRNAARGHSADMLNRNYFSHTDPEGRTLKERLPANLATRQWGENIWTGRGYDPRQVRYLAQKIMDGWMNSPGHRKNILDPGYTHLGVGVMAKNQEVKATQVFIEMAGAGVPQRMGKP